jgi:hypothetical protein
MYVDDGLIVSNEDFNPIEFAKQVILTGSDINWEKSKWVKRKDE